MEGVDVFYVIVRFVFGKFYVCGEKIGRSFLMNCVFYSVFVFENELKFKFKEDLDFLICLLFVCFELD